MTILLALVLVGALDQPRADARVDTAPLKNLTYLPSTSTPMVSFRFVFAVGSADDPAGKEGLAALTASMIAEGGTKDLNYSQVLERFYPMAASLAGGCRKEVSVFEGDVHKDNLDAYSTLVVGMLTTPRFAAEDFERLKNEAIDSISKTLRGGNDEELGKWTMQTSVFGPEANGGKRHPYGHVDRGTVEGLKAITLEDVKAFHQRYYHPGRLHLGLAGGANRAFLDKLKSDLTSLPAVRKEELVAIAKVEKPQGLHVTIVEKPTEATAISLGTPIDVTRADDDFYTLAVANSYLGEHRTFNGKLMQDLRGKRGLNYGDYSYIEDFIQEGGSTFPIPNNPQHVQAFSIWIRPVPADKTIFALRAALWEWKRLVDKGMTEAEFETTRSFLLNYSKLWVQTQSRRLGYAMDGAFYGRDDLVTELGKRLPTMTLTQVNAAIKKHLSFPGFHVAIVAKDAAALKQSLGEGAHSPSTYDTQGTPAEILAEDKVIAAYSLKDVKVKVVPVAQMFER